MALTPEDAAKARTAARELVDNYAPGAPEGVRIAAAELVAERLDMELEVSLAQGDQRVDFGSIAQRVNPFTSTCAGAMLAPWRRPRARVIEAAS